MDNTESGDYDVHCSGEDHPDPKSNGQAPNPEQDVHCFFSVTESDLGEQGAKDNFTRGKKEDLDGAGELGEPPSPDPEGESTAEGGPVGGEVPQGEDARGASLGDVAAASVDDGRSPDRAAVVEPGSVLLSASGVGLSEGEGDLEEDLPEAAESTEDWDAAFG